MSNDGDDYLVYIDTTLTPCEQPATLAVGNYYKADVVTAGDYYPFGMKMPGREYIKAGDSSYRYGFNGQEKSNEVAANTTTAEFWEYDSRIGRRWNLDPKPVIDLSPYSTLRNNPVYHIDPLGDSIPTTFYDEHGKKTGVIPKSVQDMFNSEYGIKVGYDAKRGLLYKAGDIKTNQKVSPSAKRQWEKQLGSGVSKGSLVFGYGLQVNKQLNDVVFQPQKVVGGLTTGNVSYIDLFDFRSDGTMINTTFSGVPIRAFNLGRVLEHEFIGHNIFDRRDAPYGVSSDGTEYNPGGVERIVNVFRKEMGLPLALQYTVSNQNASSGDIKYGYTTSILVQPIGYLRVYQSAGVEFVNQTLNAGKTQ